MDATSIVYNTSVAPAASPTLYSMFRDAGRNAYFIVPCAVLNTVSIPGIVMNAFLVYTSVRHR